LRLQALTRGDEGFVLSMAYSTQRGYGRTHAFVGELRIGTVAVEVDIPELGFAVEIGEIELTECETVNQFKGSEDRAAAVHPGLWPRLRPVRTQGHRDEPGRPRLRWKELGEDDRRARAGRGIRPDALRQHPGHGLPRTHQAAALRRLPGRTGAGPEAAGRGAGDAGGGGMPIRPTTSPIWTNRPSG
jgi:alpha-D-ribose 1-methylphosphonate 5-triphosphate synthase subunit PhnI